VHRGEAAITFGAKPAQCGVSAGTALRLALVVALVVAHLPTGAFMIRHMLWQRRRELA